MSCCVWPTQVMTALSCLMITLLTGCTKEPTAFAPPPPPEVTVAPPVVQPIEDLLELRGTTHAAELVEVRVRVRGYVKERSFQGGERVKAGDLLLQLDAREFEASLKQATAELAAVQGRRKLAEIELSRLQEIANRGAGTPVELDRAKASLEVATAQADLAAAAVETTEINLGYTQIVSPISGRLSIRMPEVGSLMDPQSNALVATVSDDSVIHARYTIDEAYILELRRENENRRPGEDGRPLIPLRMGIGPGEDYPFEGVHHRSDNTFDTQTGTVQVEGRFNNPDFTIIPGMYCRIQAILGERQATLVPESAILTDQQGRYIYTLDTQDKAVRVPVTLGRRVGPMRQLLGDAVKPDARIIINGLMRVQPGVAVKPTTAS